jgi:hypothetical protein
MGGAACPVDVAGGFPGLEQQPPLWRRRERKMDRLVHDLAYYHSPCQCAECIYPLQEQIYFVGSTVNFIPVQIARR